MSDVQKLDSGWGLFLKFKLMTATRGFEQVEKALLDSGIQDYHASKLLARPKPATAFTRSMAYLTRVCAASIPFPAGSLNASWDEGGKQVTAERNPNFSLKVESVKGMPEGEIAYRINISDRRLKDEDMAHVLTATYRPGLPIEILPGEQNAWDKYGVDLATLVRDSYTEYFSKYDDTDIRDVVDKELSSIKAVHVLGYTTNFIAKDSELTPNNSARAKKLVQFVHDCGHLANIYGLDATEMTRDAIVAELRSSIMQELEEYEATLDEKLGAKTKERKRGDKQRERMKSTAVNNIDRIMALADYHVTVLGVAASDIKEKADALKAKADEFMTRDFGDGAPSPSTGKTDTTTGPMVSDLEEKIAMLQAENERLRSNQGVVVGPVTQAPLPIPPPVIIEAGADPFTA